MTRMTAGAKEAGALGPVLSTSTGNRRATSSPRSSRRACDYHDGEVNDMVDVSPDIATAKARFVAAVDLSIHGLESCGGYCHGRARAQLLRHVRRVDSPPPEEKIFRVMTDRQLNMDDAVTALTVSKALQRIRAEKRVSITRAIDAVTASISAESLLGKLSLADSVEDSTSRVRCSVNDTVLAPTHHVHSVQSATCTVPKHGLSCAAVPRTSESKIGATKTKNGRRRTSVRSPGDSTEETETLCENDESAKGQVPLGKPSLDLDKEIAQKVDLPPSQNEINSNRTAKRTGSQTKQQVTCKRQRSTNGGAIGNTPSGLGTE